MTIKIRLQNHFFGGVKITANKKAQARIILPGLLTGKSLKDLADDLACTEGSTKVFSNQIRKSLQIYKSSPFALIGECLKRGIKIEIGNIDVKRFEQLDRNNRDILESAASDIRSAECPITKGLDTNGSSFLRKTAFEKIAGSNTDWNNGKSLLAAMTFRAVQIHKARLADDHSLFPKTGVVLFGNEPN